MNKSKSSLRFFMKRMAATNGVAENNTLFLDESRGIPLALQSNLLQSYKHSIRETWQ